jgi:hypothetical protein
VGAEWDASLEVTSSATGYCKYLVQGGAWCAQIKIQVQVALTSVQEISQRQLALVVTDKSRTDNEAKSQRDLLVTLMGEV